MHAKRVPQDATDSMTSRRGNDSRASREGERFLDGAPAAGQVASGAAGADSTQPAQTWDPYDVWLTRVKQPRDETRRLRKRDQQDVAARSEAEGADAPTAEPTAKPSAA
jgi:hypothetical protein